MTILTITLLKSVQVALLVWHALDNLVRVGVVEQGITYSKESVVFL